MQFIAEDPVHVVIRNELAALSDNSGVLVRDRQRRLYAKFKRGTAPEWASALGVATYEFRKRPDGVTSEQWLAFYDSHEDQLVMGWTDDEREVIEAKLQTVDGVIKVEKPRLAPPWPAYDKLVAKKGTTEKQLAAKIVAKVEEDGYDLHDVLAYELENEGRPEVVEALQEQIGAPAEASAVEEEDGELIEA